MTWYAANADNIAKCVELLEHILSTTNNETTDINEVAFIECIGRSIRALHCVQKL